MKDESLINSHIISKKHLLRTLARELGLALTENQWTDDVIQDCMFNFANEATETKIGFNNLGSPYDTKGNKGKASIRSFLLALKEGGVATRTDVSRRTTIIKTGRQSGEVVEKGGGLVARSALSYLIDIRIRTGRGRSRQNDKYIAIALNYLQRDDVNQRAKRVIKISLLGDPEDPQLVKILTPYLYSNDPFFGDPTKIPCFRGKINYTEYRTTNDDVIDISSNLAFFENAEEVATEKLITELKVQAIESPINEKTHEQVCTEVTALLESEKYSASNDKIIHQELLAIYSRKCNSSVTLTPSGMNPVSDQNARAKRNLLKLNGMKDQFPPHIRKAIQEAMKNPDIFPKELFRKGTLDTLQFSNITWSRPDIPSITYFDDGTVKIIYSHSKVRGAKHARIGQDLIELQCNGTCLTPQDILSSLKGDKKYIKALLDEYPDEYCTRYKNAVGQLEGVMIEGEKIEGIEFDKVVFENRLRLFENFYIGGLKGTVDNYKFNPICYNVCTGRRKFSIGKTGEWKVVDASKIDFSGIEGIDPNDVPTTNMKAIQDQFYAARRELDIEAIRKGSRDKIGKQFTQNIILKLRVFFKTLTSPL